MIPSIEEIVAGLATGDITREQAIEWLEQHVEAAYAMGAESLRDHFAGLAMHAELVTAGALEGPAEAFVEGMVKAGHTVGQHLASNAYEVANAMLKARGGGLSEPEQVLLG